MNLLVFAIVFLATTSQTAIGFGVALVSMPLLSLLTGVREATPLVALIATLLEIILLICYRASFKWRAITRLLVSASIGIPVGVWALGTIPERLALTALGIALIGYATYALVVPKMPVLGNPNWAYLFGFASGCLGGAYTTSGPPVIAYGHLRGWPQFEFKANLQGFFVVNSLMIAIAQILGGNVTTTVQKRFVLAIPAVVLGVAAGTMLDRFISQEQFQKYAMVALLILGASLFL